MLACCCRCIWFTTRCTQTLVRDTLTTDSFDIQDINLSQQKRSNLVASVMRQVNVQASMQLPGSVGQYDLLMLLLLMLASCTR